MIVLLMLFVVFVRIVILFFSFIGCFWFVLLYDGYEVSECL